MDSCCTSKKKHSSKDSLCVFVCLRCVCVCVFGLLTWASSDCSPLPHTTCARCSASSSPDERNRCCSSRTDTPINILATPTFLLLFPHHILEGPATVTGGFASASISKHAHTHTEEGATERDEHTHKHKSMLESDRFLLSTEASYNVPRVCVCVCVCLYTPVVSFRPVNPPNCPASVY